MGVCQISPPPSIAHGQWHVEVGNLGCVALAVSFSRFHSSHRLICFTEFNCHVDKQPAVVGDLFLDY